MFHVDDMLERDKLMSTLSIIPLMVVICFTVGCTTTGLSAPANKNVRIIEQISLASTIEETSGLFCTAKGALTINDSGNEAKIYRIAANGKITSTEDVAAENNDWEAITADKDYYYIGDIGNNRGKREDLQILKVSRFNHALVSTIPVKYQANNPASNSAYDHDYDGEALVAKDGHVMLFSKSWKSQLLHVYRISKEGGNEQLVPIKSIEGLPGLVTGADWSASLNSYLLVGYSVKTFGGFESFFAMLDPDFNITFTEPLALGQVEGVCAHISGDIWVSQEGSGNNPAKLIKLKLQN